MEYNKEAKHGDYSPPNENEVQLGDIHDNADNLHRRLSNRQIQLLAIGGSIGTALFVSIGNGLAAGGPGSLFLAYALYACVVACVNNCVAEMIIYQPISGGFIRLAGHWVDEALGFMVGWNFFIYEALLIPFEITALNLVLSFWSDNIPVAAICAACIVLYAYGPPIPHCPSPDARLCAVRALGLDQSSLGATLLPSRCARPPPYMSID